MTKKKGIGLSLAVLGLIFVVYNLFVFLFLTPETPVFWISYGFMVLAFLAQIVGMYLSFKEFDVQAVFFGIPLAQFTLFYFLAQVFVSTVFMIFQNISWKIPVFLQVVLFVIYVIFAIVSVATRDASKASKDHYQGASAAMRMKTVDIESLRDEAADPVLKEQLRRLAETVRYADPVSTPAIADVDARIYQETLNLQTLCMDHDAEGAKASCAALQRLYVERSRKLLATK